MTGAKWKLLVLVSVLLLWLSCLAQTELGTSGNNETHNNETVEHVLDGESDTPLSPDESDVNMPNTLPAEVDIVPTTLPLPPSVEVVENKHATTTTLILTSSAPEHTTTKELAPPASSSSTTAAPVQPPSASSPEEEE